MSFVRTLATLAVGFAAAKGYDKFKDMGGMAGMKGAMRDNPAMQNMQDQAADFMTRMGIPGADNMRAMMDQFTGQAEGAADSAAAGLSGLMAALGGGMAAGASNTAKMVDAISGNSMASDAMEAHAKLMIRAMVQAAKADGEIDADEQARIMEHLGDLNEEERAFVMEQMAAPVDPMALAQDTGEQMAAQVYATSIMAMKVDDASEVAYLNQLAQALNLSDEARARVHKAMGLT
ncbi:MAG: DUF533 domain-containing protein [Pseudomonadota bacterium]